jgi:pseudouridine synthase
MSEAIRIQKLLATWGLASRRTIEEWITQGRISVNGRVLREQGCRVCPEVDQITVNGVPVVPPIGPGDVVQALHKPFGVLTSMSDPFGRPTVKELMPAQPRLYPVGRLDVDSTGLLLVTNHGELAHRLMHPRYKVEKEYVATLRGGDLDPAQQMHFARGIDLEGRPTMPCRIEKITVGRFRVTLTEGRNRQVRRMFQALGQQVQRLERVRFGPVVLGSLPSGILRPLTEREFFELLRLTALAGNSSDSADSVGGSDRGNPQERPTRSD